MNQIESYHISKSEHGIITLIVNTKDRWLDYRGVLTYSPEHDTEVFSLETFEDEEQTGEITILETEFPFDKANEVQYLESHSQEKEQIYFYWIPRRLLIGDEYTKHFKSKLK